MIKDFVLKGQNSISIIIARRPVLPVGLVPVRDLFGFSGQKRAYWTGVMAQVIEPLLCKHKTLSSNLSYQKRKEGRKERNEKKERKECGGEMS
jgi:hypothetical protein